MVRVPFTPQVLGDLHLQDLRPGLLVLRQVQDQDTFLELGLNLGRIGVVRQREAAQEPAVLALV